MTKVAGIDDVSLTVKNLEFVESKWQIVNLNTSFSNSNLEALDVRVEGDKEKTPVTVTVRNSSLGHFTVINTTLLSMEKCSSHDRTISANDILVVVINSNVRVEDNDHAIHRRHVSFDHFWKFQHFQNSFRQLCS